ncbi:hypothetical protein QBC37DRAFT_136266 [Rhypophila decipiens]|uniref:Enoyl reductase (ER) domain-containing protein n=1 Tax=Rhypophila decipiens TaxID=261697 RepID=A0AAN7BFI5_9PEZI|nr:hypothetical protein QBC37DRAFT_136266 [Rhypophila decipiens]
MAAWPRRLKGQEPPILALIQTQVDSNLEWYHWSWPGLGAFPRPQHSYVIKVATSSITRGESSQWANRGSPGPYVLRYDFAGWVVSAPRGARYQPGDEVYGFTSINTVGRFGNACTYTRASLEEVCEKPRNISFPEAATIPLSAVTAFQALFRTGTDISGCSDGILALPGDGCLEPPRPELLENRSHPNSGCRDDACQNAACRNATRTILVVGAGGAVGTMVVQLARLAGVRTIVGICNEQQKRYVQYTLGATLAVAYHEKGHMEKYKYGPLPLCYDYFFDAVIDCVGGEALHLVAGRYVKEGGRLLSIAEGPRRKDMAIPLFQILNPSGPVRAPLDAYTLWKPATKLIRVASRVTVRRMTVKPNFEDLKAVTRMVSGGYLRPTFSKDNILFESLSDSDWETEDEDEDTKDEDEDEPSVDEDTKDKDTNEPKLGKMVVRVSNSRPTVDLIEKLRRYGRVTTVPETPFNRPRLFTKEEILAMPKVLRPPPALSATESNLFNPWKRFTPPDGARPRPKQRKRQGQSNLPVATTSTPLLQHKTRWVLPKPLLESSPIEGRGDIRPIRRELSPSGRPSDKSRGGLPGNSSISRPCSPIQDERGKSYTSYTVRSPSPLGPPGKETEGGRQPLPDEKPAKDRDDRPLRKDIAARKLTAPPHPLAYFNPAALPGPAAFTDPTTLSNRRARGPRCPVLSEANIRVRLTENAEGGMEYMPVKKRVLPPLPPQN